MSTLPLVWLKSHAYQNVTAIVVTRPLTKMEGCKPPSSKKNKGRCQPATSGARIMVASSGERSACKPGRATPFQPGCSPNGPSAGLTRRTANSIRNVLTELKASDGTLAPAATSSPAVARKTASGRPKATTYQYHLTRQRIIRNPSTFNPAQPWVMGITMRAAKSGPEGKNLTASMGKNAHDIAQVKTKNVTIGCRFTTLKRRY